VQQIRRLDLPEVDADRTLALLQVYQEYARAADHRRDLLAQGLTDEADSYQLTTVDPALATLLGTLTELSGTVQAITARTRILADAGTAATFVVTAGMIVALGGARRMSRLVQQTQSRMTERNRLIVQESLALIAVLRRDGMATFLTPTAERLIGFDPTRESLDDGSDVVLRTVHPDDRATLLEALDRVRPDSGLLHGELRFRVGADQSGEQQPEGSWRTFEASFRDHTGDPGLAGVLLTAHDVTHQRELQNELRRRTLYDTLTGLPNRALLTDRIQQALGDGDRHGLHVGLLIIDLDRFKEINDTLGHHYGDQLLVQVGRTLRQVLRGVDSVARLGGDEFAVLLPQVSDLDGACAVAWKVHDALEHSFVVESVELDVEASIGVAVSEADGTDSPTSLLQRADVAMYVAKGRSLGVAGYDRSEDINTPERLALLGDLRRALSNDELYLVYQPKVSLADGSLRSVEALLRWKHPERGPVPPDAFIPLAENTGLIGAITHHVLDLALAQARVWSDAGRTLRVAVNVSARNLHDDEFDRSVRALLTRHGVDPTQLLLEVTESALMADPVRAREVLQRLAEQGISISIDDFGAGYTSIKQLRSLPISELKVDRSFVQAMEEDPGEEMIVRSVIELGRNLGLTTVAEGVETPEALVKLAAFGCDTAQGYVLARPMPAADLEQWRQQWRGLELVGG